MSLPVQMDRFLLYVCPSGICALFYDRFVYIPDIAEAYTRETEAMVLYYPKAPMFVPKGIGRYAQNSPLHCLKSTPWSWLH